MLLDACAKHGDLEGAERPRAVSQARVGEGSHVRVWSHVGSLWGG